MQATHLLLQQQLGRHPLILNGRSEPTELQEFLRTIDAAYQEFDRERLWAETVHSQQSRVLELIATGAPLREVLIEVTRMVESQSPEMMCAFMMTEPNDLPVPEHGLPASWSVPILSRQGQELATFCAYHHPPRRPHPDELKLLDLASRIGGIAIQRSHADALLRATEEQLRQVHKMEAIGRLAGGIAHDFNNMLTAIQGNVAMIGLGGLSPEEQAAAVGDALHAVERATVLTRQLLTFSRREPLELQILDLNEVAANIAKMLQRLIGEHISLEEHFVPTGAPVQADRGMMEQVLMNLALNSRDAMSAGGQLALRTEIVALGEETPRKAQARPGTFVHLSVGDTGCGIAPDDLPRIFEPFYTTKDVGKGTGLGLATVFGIVQQHRGWIEVESEVGRGATIHLFLPRVASPPPSAAKAPAGLHRPRGHETILLVEDETDVRTLMNSLLTRHGYRVLTADSGPAALRIWRVHSPLIDLLITDMIMPLGITGRELITRLRSEKPALKVVQCSANGDELPDGQPPREMTSFLEKPFAPNRLLQVVRSTLDTG